MKISYSKSKKIETKYETRGEESNREKDDLPFFGEERIYTHK